MDSLVLIERLDELMAEAKPIPLTREARVDRDEVYKILDRLRTTLPVEFERVRWMGREAEQEQGVEGTLRQITEAVTELRRAQRAQAERPSGPPLTVAAAEQVREIVEAAERTAAGVEREANAEAKRLREEAGAHLQRAREEAERHLRETRERAAEEAADYLRRVEDATKKMLERANSAGSEIDGMLANLRGSGGSVIEDLEAIMAGLTDIEVRRSETAVVAQAGARSTGEAAARPSGAVRSVGEEVSPADPPEAPMSRVARLPAGARRVVVRPAAPPQPAQPSSHPPSPPVAAPLSVAQPGSAAQQPQEAGGEATPRPRRRAPVEPGQALPPEQVGGHPVRPQRERRPQPPEPPAPGAA